MSPSARQRRIERATELRAQNPASKEVLDFFLEIMRFGEELKALLEQMRKDGQHGFNNPIASEVASRFPRFLNLIETTGPEAIVNEAEKVGNLSDTERRELLRAFWMRPDTASALVGPQAFLARAFL